MFRLVLIKLLVFTVALALLAAFSIIWIPAMLPFQSFTWIALVFFFLVTTLSLYIGLKGLEKSSYGFVASVNGIVLLKLMLSVVLIIVYMLLVKPKDPVFIVPFFLFYIFFTVFEVRELLLTQNKKTGPNK